MQTHKDITILAIESSCDDTSAAIIKNGKILTNIISSQKIHELYGGVVPELASRAHQKNIVPTVDVAIKKAGVTKQEINAVAFTRGPGLMGSLLVGVSFAKAFALANRIPLIEVNHMQAHVLANFINDKADIRFPLLCLTVSGGHTQLVFVQDYLQMKVIGETLDDAAGEAFDKIAKMLGLGYPGGPMLDKLGKLGDERKFQFTIPKVEGLNYSFSGLKTQVLYFSQKNEKVNPNFINENLNDICASVQKTIIDILFTKLKRAAEELKVNQIAIAGGVSANSYLRKRLTELSEKKKWNIFIPDFEYCTDNAAMIAIAAHYKFLANDFVGQDITPLARYQI